MGEASVRRECTSHGEPSASVDGPPGAACAFFARTAQPRMEYERLLMDHVCEEQLLCDHDTRDGTRHGPRFVIVTVCKAAGGAVCDRRAIHVRSKAGKSEPTKRARAVRRPPGMPPGPLPRAAPAPRGIFRLRGRTD
jgi:hypothetical protein